MEGLRLRNKNILGPILLGAILAVAVFAATFFTLQFFAGQPGNTAGDLRALQQKLDFPLYNIALPQGFTPFGKPVIIESNAVTQTIEVAGKKIIVTQQKRPKIMEEVTKTQEWTLPIGQAYLANLNNKTAGFIVTEKTLLIFSSPNDASAEQLIQAMNSSTKL